MPANDGKSTAASAPCPDAHCCSISSNPYGTFLAEQGTGMVVVSAQGYQETARFLDLHQWAAQMDLNLRWMFQNQRPVPVIEVEQGLLYTMENEGFRIWDAIRDHSSLVPLVNRPDLLLRLHDHLVNVVVCTNLNGYWAVLGMLQVNGQWHAAVNNNSLRHLAAFYRGSLYNSTDQTPQVQGFQLLRYHRNPSAHGLEHAVPPGPVDPSTVPPARCPEASCRGWPRSRGTRHSGAAELRAVADRSHAIC